MAEPQFYVSGRCKINRSSLNMEPTSENIIAALKEQILATRQTLTEAGYNPAPVREQVADLAQRYGSSVLDVGTGACACLAVALARHGFQVTAIDHASSAVRIAQERIEGNLENNLDIRYIDAVRMPFSDGSYRVVTAFDALCHASEPDAVLKEMFRVGSHAIIITELNATGRIITHHLDEGFEDELIELLNRHCQNCQLFEDAHHVTILCQKKMATAK